MTQSVEILARFLRLAGALLLGSLGLTAQGQPVITEIMAVAADAFPDEDGEASDWIEIQNQGAETLTLGGSFLTDSPSQLTRWQIPEGVTLEPGSFLVVFASGKDRSDPGKSLHTNFSLDGNGEFLALVSPDGTTIVSGFGDGFPAQRKGIAYGTGSTASNDALLVETGANASWHVPTGEIDGWTAADFDDANWAPARTGIGFDYDGLVGEGGDVRESSVQKNASVYVRIPFVIENPDLVGRMTLRAKYEDGFVAFINGMRVAAANAPAVLTYDSRATTSRPDVDAVQFADFAVSAQLAVGLNVLAVQIMNTSPGGSDLLLLPELTAEVSTAERTLVYLSEPTPGEANGTGFLGFAGAPMIDKSAGYYDAPIQVTIASPAPNATIRYTTNGSPPTEDTGVLYERAFTVDRTTIVRATAFAEGLRPSETVTRSFLFVADILTQEDTADPRAHWDTEMDPAVVNDTDQTWSVAEGLTAIPVLSIALPDDDLFGRSSGIYQNATRRGPDWEKACSAEYFYPDAYTGYRGGDGKGFTLDCGIVINGNFSRLTHNPKHSFRLKFKDEYGPSKLEFPLFPERGTEIFDTIAVRTGHNQGWATGISETQLMRNQFSRDLQGLDPDQFVARGNWVHLYLNGQYWGVYNFHERPDDAFGAAVYGGNKDEYDVHKGLRQGGSSRALTIAGNRDAWAEMFRIASRDMEDPENYAAIQPYLDIDQLIDYTIGLHYTGDLDGPTGLGVQATQPKNFYAMRRRHPDGRFRFFRWDSEFTLQSASVDVTNRRGTENPAMLHWNLSENPEYRMRFADRVHRYFFNDGPLTPENAAQLYLDRIAFIDEAIVAESARWGDSKRSRPYTRDVEWIRERNRLVNSWFPRRSNTVISQWRKKDLYPEAEAPTFSINDQPQHGGKVSSTDSLTLTLSEDAGAIIYFTTDGSDPRLPQTPEAQPAFTILADDAPRKAWIPQNPGDGFESNGISWTSPDFVEPDGWLEGAGAIGFESSFLPGDYVDLIKFDLGQMFTVTASALVRIPFELTEEQITGIQVLTLRARYDDGFVAYINGMRVASANAPTVLDGSETATDSHLDVDALQWEEFSAGAGVPVLRTGTNVLAVHALNQSVRGSDFLNSVELIGQSNNTIAPSSQAYSEGITLPASAVIRARALDGEEWSALTEAVFQVDTVPATLANVVISEIHYNPATPSDAEVTAGFAERSLFEFIELMNISADTTDLSGVAFIDGIEFNFSRLQLPELAPGARGVIVSNHAAFEFRYGTDIHVLGEFARGSLNDGGETVALQHADETVRQFTYNDRAPWPESADGDGFSLVLASPETNPDSALPESWRSSDLVGGSPGTGIEVLSVFDAWLASNGLASETGDPDLDGLVNLLEYAFGLDPRMRSTSPLRIVAIDTGIEIRYRLSTTASAEITDVVEFSDDLLTWHVLPANGIDTSRSVADGTTLVSHRLTGPQPLARSFRLRVQK